MDQKYLSRNGLWHVIDGKVVFHDTHSPHAPRMITMEPWHELIFSAADGIHTVGDLVQTLGARYEEGPPEGLKEQVHDIVQILLDEQVILIHDEPKSLPVYMERDSTSFDPDELRELLAKDGWYQ